MLELNNVGIIREDWVLRNIDLKLKFDQRYGVIGKSGAGKTTLLKSMSGLIDLNAGEVLFDGTKIIGPQEKLIPGYEEIQLVNQDFAIEPYHTVFENVKEKVLSRHIETQIDLVDEYLELVELNDIRHRKAHLLSGGEQQRLSIARALASEPKVLLLDEPFVHIDQRLRRKILHYIKELQEIREMLVVMVSHDGSELMGFANEIIYLLNGSIARQDSASNVYYSPSSKEEGQLLGEVNQIELNGEVVIFRPNQYSFDSPNLNLEYISSEDIGHAFLNYFRLDDGKEVILASMSVMNDVEKIRITK